MSIRTIALIVVVGFIAVQAFRFQARGTKIADLETDTTHYRAQIQVMGRRENYLITVNSRLRADSAGLSGENKYLKTQNAIAVANAATARYDLENRVASGVNQKSALQKKQGADRPAGGVGVVPTTVKDTTLNADFAKLKDQVREYSEVIVPGYIQENGALTKRAETAEGKVSELETTLNSQRNSSAKRTERIGKHFLGLGSQKAILKAANDIRAGRE